MNTDRLPPNEIAAEQAALGCCLTAPSDCLPLCIERASREAFFDLRNQIVFSGMVGMFSRSEPIDLVTLHLHLKAIGQLEQIGGVPYLNTLLDSVTSTANLSYYLDILMEQFQLRRMVAVGTQIVSKAYDVGAAVERLLDEAERDILALRVDKSCGTKPVTELVQSAIDRIEDMHNRQGAMGGIATGLADFDKLTDGMHGGEMIVIAARPSIGKTALAMGIAEHVAINAGLPVGVFSLEMMAEQLLLRSLCSTAKINLRDVRSGLLKEHDFPKCSAAAGKLSKSPLYIDDTSGLSIMQLRARARRLWQQFGIRLFVVDYLQLLHSTSPRCADNRQQEIADISGGIKNLSKELNVPVLVLSQLNREIEKDKSKRPKLSHLRESGAIEQDADVVGLLYTPGVTEAETQDESDSIPVNLIIAKQRNGPLGTVKLMFHRAQTRFEKRVEKPDAEDIPRRHSNDD